jgi:hypothetical protein
MSVPFLRMGRVCCRARGLTPSHSSIRYCSIAQQCVAAALLSCVTADVHGTTAFECAVVTPTAICNIARCRRGPGAAFAFCVCATCRWACARTPGLPCCAVRGGLGRVSQLQCLSVSARRVTTALPLRCARTALRILMTARCCDCGAVSGRETSPTPATGWSTCVTGAWSARTTVSDAPCPSRCCLHCNDHRHLLCVHGTPRALAVVHLFTAVSCPVSADPYISDNDPTDRRCYENNGVSPANVYFKTNAPVAYIPRLKRPAVNKTVRSCVPLPVS